MDELKYKILNYILTVNKYEKYIKEIYKIPILHKCLSGYIINLITYIELKKIIHYKDLNKFISVDDSHESLLNKIQNLIESEEITEPKLNIEQIHNKTSSEFIELINNRNEYLLINEEFWKDLCKFEPKEIVKPINYYINYSKLVLILKDKNQINFELNSKNILRKKSYLYTINYINDNLFDYAKSIVEYYIFENKIKNDLRNDEDFFLKEIHIGYLIEKVWIDEWKKKTLYEEIKNKYLTSNYMDKDSYIINNIINQILLFYKNKIKEINLNEFNIININKLDITTILKKTSLVIVNSSFLFLFDKNKNKLEENNYFKFSCQKGNIAFKGNYKFITNNNIILSSDEKDKDINIKIMIRIFYFQIFLQQKIELLNKSNFKKVYIVNKDFVQKYKNNYKYESISNILINNYKLFFEITNYESLTDEIIEKIINNYIPKELKEEIFKIENISNEDLKLAIVKEKSQKYIYDFELIPNDIILNKKCYLNEKCVEGEYCIENNKIILLFYEKNYCEIGQIKNGLFIEEYIIENNKQNNVTSLKENIFQIILQKSNIKGNLIQIGKNKYNIIFLNKEKNEEKEENEKYNLNNYNNINIINLIISSLISNIVGIKISIIL